jgi:V8-like Glu-specific endopeptidase
MPPGEKQMTTLRTERTNARWSHTFFAALVLLSTACGELEDFGPAPEVEPTTGMINQPIRYGNLDGDAHPGVLRLYIRVGNSGFLCSGSIIEQRTILTAAHCIENAATASDIYAVIDGAYRPANNMFIHEQYSPNAPHIRSVSGNWYRFSGPDIALITFADDLPGPIVSIGAQAPAQGDLLTIVGFGSDENETTGVRRVGQVEYQATTETYLEDQQTVDNNVGSLVVNPGPNNELVCGGDSGGALLMGDVLVGVTSGGVVAVGDDNPCVRSRSANFISPHAYIDWIESKVALPSNEASPISDELVCSAYLLDQASDFQVPNSYALNWGGRNEKWFVNSDSQWHFILPEGTVYRWNVGSTPPSGELVGTLSPAFHTNPELVTDAAAPAGDCEAPAVDAATLVQTAYDMDQNYSFRFNGSYATNWAGMGEKWIVDGNNAWFYITPNGDVNRWTNGSKPVVGEVIGRLSADYHANPALLHDAQDPNAEDNGDCNHDTAEGTAYELDQAYGFRGTGSYAEGWGGHGEKWFQNASSNWFFITPSGDVYRWTQNTQPAEGTLVGTLNADYHTDPTLLLEAVQPEATGCDNDLATEAQSMDETFDFRGTGSYNTNWGSVNEKWFTNGSSNWFYILPNGDVYRWTVGTRPLEGTLVGQLNGSYWDNPALLHDAAQ